METINSILYCIAIWTIIGGSTFAYLSIKQPEIPSGWCKVINLLCGPGAWCVTVVCGIREDLKNPEAWK